MTRSANATAQLFRWANKGICNDSNEEFQSRIDAAITALVDRAGYTENAPGQEPVLNLFGYGTVHEALSKPGDPTKGLFWGHEAAEALGWDPAEFDKWARSQWHFDLVQQRAQDEESGTVGWDCIQHHPVNVSVWQGEGTSDDHYVDGAMSGPIMRYWVDLWLIDTDRIMSMMLDSPWGEEWMKAVRPLMAWGMEESGLSAVLNAVRTDTGAPLGDLFRDQRKGISKQEAIEQALRGPVVEDTEGGSPR